MGEDVHRWRVDADHQPPGRRQPPGRVAAKIEAGRYLCWKAAHYMDRHDSEGHALGGDEQDVLRDLMQRAVFDCMRVVGVNALDRSSGWRSRIGSRSSSRSTTPGTWRCRTPGVGVMADPGFTPDLFVDPEPFGFRKSMEGFGVDPDMS